jgi:hypothetical protein
VCFDIFVPVDFVSVSHYYKFTAIFLIYCHKFDLF